MQHAIVAIDPGPVESGFVWTQGGKILHSGVKPNYDLFQIISVGGICLAVETMQATYGTVGKETIQTLIWVGRYIEQGPPFCLLISRQQVKSIVCGNVKASDAGVRQALIEKIGPKGTANNPGPTWGVKSHAWAALAVAYAADHLITAGEYSAYLASR